MKGLFVTGTDTNVGKTVVSAALMCALRPKEDVCYWKPIQTGTEYDNDTKMVRGLADCAGDDIFDDGIRLERPWSPHLSARLANVSFSVKEILNCVESHRTDRFWIVEGAGGPLVPLNDDEMMIDLIAALHLPVVVVARSTLGTINHTLLTLEALRSRGLYVAGVVMNRGLNKSNRDAIEHFGGVRVIFDLPEFENDLGGAVQAWAAANSEDIHARLN